MNHHADEFANLHTHFRRHQFFRASRYVAGGIVVAVLFGFFFGWLVMLLWNWLMPEIFGLSVISYWQAFGIVILSKLIFSGIGGHHNQHKPRDPRMFSRDPRFGYMFREMRRGWAEDEWEPAGEPRNWRYYRQYWKERGRKDFEDYLAQMKSAKAGNDSH